MRVSMCVCVVRRHQEYGLDIFGVFSFVIFSSSYSLSSNLFNAANEKIYLTENIFGQEKKAFAAIAAAIVVVFERK